MTENRSVFVAIFISLFAWSIAFFSLINFWAGIIANQFFQKEKENQVFTFDYQQLETDYKDYQLRQTQQQLISEGLESLENHDYMEGITNMYYAKTIFPYELEPRFFLMYAFMTTCEDKGRYCGNAQKEIQRAYDFIENQSLDDAQKFRVDLYSNWWKRVMGREDN